MKTNIFKMTLPAVALLIAGLSSANATPTLTLTDGAGDTVTGVLGPAGAGQYIFSGSIGDWKVNVSTALSYPLLGSTTAPEMDLNSTEVYSAGSKNGTVIPLGNTLTLTFSVDGFVYPGGLVTAGIGGTESANMTTLFTTTANGNPLTSTAVITTSPYAVAKTGIAPALGTLTETVVLTAGNTRLGQVSSTSFNANLTATVPDSGMTLSLLGSSLTVLGLFARSRKSVA